MDLAFDPFDSERATAKRIWHERNGSGGGGRVHRTSRGKFERMGFDARDSFSQALMIAQARRVAMTPAQLQEADDAIPF